jgi:EAL domain-containing protein (putative c-di-GMP-specific phosphodiesterase class I)
VVRKVFRQQVVWREHGIDIDISLNVSAQDIQDDGFIDYVRKVLDETGADPSHLTLEITERTAVDHLDSVQTFIMHAKRLGFSIGIDDFGIAHSSLHEISQIYFDVLKIDKSFIDHVAKDKRNDEVVRFIIQMAHQLGAITVAEGVEHVTQEAWLRDNGCDYVQGYLVSRPLEPERFEAWYNAQKTEAER